MRFIHFRPLFTYVLAILGIGMLTGVMFAFGTHINPTTVALIFLLFILFLATTAGSTPALIASVLAMFCFNYFFLPPIGTLTISDPQNWMALIAFFVVAITAGQLSAKAKQRAVETERLYAKLQKAFEKASEAEAFRCNEKLKSTLLDAVTHDLRMPLTSIKASVTMLIDEQVRKPGTLAFGVPVAVFVVAIIISAYVQNFVVKPNELGRETAYIEHNINGTRAGFNLEKVESREYPANTTPAAFNLKGKLGEAGQKLDELKRIIEDLQKH